MFETPYTEQTFFEMQENGLIHKILDWSHGCFAGRKILGVYKIATKEQIKNSPKVTEHYTSHPTRGFYLQDGEYLIAVKHD